MLDFNGPPDPPVPSVKAIAVGVGLGKTRTWRERVPPAFERDELAGVLAVPRHKVGDEVVRDLAEQGLSACVYRGREADDPDQLGKTMCHDLERVGLISEALGGVRQCACKYKGEICEFFTLCGYQKQSQQKPLIWIVPHQLIFRKRLAFIPHPSSLVIDEAFWQASLKGVE